MEDLHSNYYIFILTFLYIMCEKVRLGIVSVSRGRNITNALF